LKRKYGSTIQEVLAFAEECRRGLEALASPEETEKALESRLSQLGEAYLALGGDVSRRRREGAPRLERALEKELAQLAMERTRFRVQILPADPFVLPSGPSREAWTPRGFDAIEFLVSANAGEDLRPLARVASGGELSRVLLALMCAVDSGTDARTLTFDEVDAGIGGRVAGVVGNRLRRVARGHQVLCVTHLPQIAAVADHHFFVSKAVQGERTVATVRRLSDRERVEEVARMLAGHTITESARQHAAELLKKSL
jgi:DNA repair protein RecN (Recombination protein N)